MLDNIPSRRPLILAAPPHRAPYPKRNASEIRAVATNWQRAADMCSAHPCGGNPGGIQARVREELFSRRSGSAWNISIKGHVNQ